MNPDVIVNNIMVIVTIRAWKFPRSARVYFHCSHRIQEKFAHFVATC